MKKLVIDQSKVNKEIAEQLVKLCPFNAIEYKDGKLDVNAACKTCGACCRKFENGPMSLVEEKEENTIDKSLWKGIAVFAEVENGKIHPVVIELIGKAKELAKKVNFEVYAVLFGNKEQVENNAEELLLYGVNKVYCYKDEKLKDYNAQIYTKVMADFIEKVKPSVVLYGGTYLGRSFAPRVAARFKTGLTADCTMLDIKENSDLVQVRPAFGGNVMAQIVCAKTRPQMSTVRYKIFKKAEKTKPIGEVIYMDVKDIDFKSNMSVIKISKKEKSVDISEADVIVAVGRAFKTEEDLNLAKALSDELNGIVACSRPLVENGVFEPKYQIGLSGKTVAPKLIIAIGISGAVQFNAGIKGSEKIIAINSDKKAPIFDIANYGIVGNFKEVLPKLIDKIREIKNV